MLNFHPHVHLLVTDGVFERGGTFTRFTYFDNHLIERLFRAEVLRLLVGKGLICQDVVDNLMSWQHSGFSVHGEVQVPDRDAAYRLYPPTSPFAAAVRCVRSRSESARQKHCTSCGRCGRRGAPMLCRYELVGDRLPRVPPAHRTRCGRFAEKQFTIRQFTIRPASAR